MRPHLVLCAILVSILPGWDASASRPCRADNDPSLGYGLGPLTLEVTPSGLQGSIGGSIVRPYGTFSADTGYVFRNDDEACTIVIRWGDVEQVYKLGGPVDIQLEGVGEGMDRGATLKIVSNERTDYHIVVEISGEPSTTYYDALVSHGGGYVVFQRDFDQRAWGGIARVMGTSTFSIEVRILKYDTLSGDAIVEIISISRYWQGNWGATGTRERNIQSMPVADQRDGRVVYEPPDEFGGTVEVGKTYAIPTWMIQNEQPF